MIDVGIFGLDTSHAEGFADFFHARDDAAVRGVWDSGDVRDDDYVREFCEEYGAARYEDPERLRGAVDAALILTVDWNSHVPLAVDCLAAGVPTLVDKPVAGSAAALSELDAAADDTPVFGGSALPYHDDFAALPRTGQDRTLFAAGYNDSFYYRVHLVDTVSHLVAADWRRVAPGPGPGTTVDVRFEDGTCAILRFDGPPESTTFSVLEVGEVTTTVELEISPASLAAMYDSYLAAFLSVVKGDDADRFDHGTDRLLDAASLALAVEAAVDQECTVGPDSEELRAVTVDSDEFVADYSPYY